MEEAVWIFFGVIALLFTIGIITQLVIENKNEAKIQRFETSIELLESQCNYVCSSPLDTLLSIIVELPSGIIIRSDYEDKGKLCAEYNDELKCSYCNCDLTPYVLNLSSALVRSSFVTHNYKCFFERLQDNVRLECQG